MLFSKVGGNQHHRLLPVQLTFSLLPGHLCSDMAMNWPDSWRWRTGSRLRAGGKKVGGLAKFGLRDDVKQRDGDHVENFQSDQGRGF